VRTSRHQLPGANTRSIPVRQKIYTAVESVKPRAANPTLYQSAARGERSTESYGGVSQEVVRAISAPGDSNIDDSTSGGKELFQPSREDVRLADEALASDAEGWGRSVDRYVNGTLVRTRPVTMLRQTPLVLQMLGARNLPIRTLYGVMDKVLSGKHNLPAELVKQIPAAMADPIMVFKTASQTAISDLTMMLELKDAHGATVVVPVVLAREGSKGYSLNLVPSMYVKNYEETKSLRNDWFLEQIEKGRLRYINNTKSHEWAGSVGRQLPAGGTPTFATEKKYTRKPILSNRARRTPRCTSPRPGGSVPRSPTEVSPRR